LTSPATRRLLAYRLVIPMVALVVLAGFALIWVAGWHSVYFAALHYFGVLRPPEIQPWYFPFLDGNALLAAAECQRHGIDVYLENPCDVLGRVHVYSPLWLSVIPGFLSTADAPWVGSVLDLIFILCLAAIFRPRSWSEIALFVVAVFSPSTIYAMERANNDVAVFILVVCGSLFLSKRYGHRIVGYGLFLLAGLLKYYPLVLLILILRERWQRAFVLATGAGLGILALIAGYQGELLIALRNIPRLSPFMFTFAAQNLPYGMLEVMWGPQTHLHKLAGPALYVILAAGAFALAWRQTRLLGHYEIDWTGWETRNLTIASVLLPACFFASQNEGYRGVFLLLALPGLVSLRHLVNDPSVRLWLTRMIVFALLIMWGEFFRRGYDTLMGLGSPEFAQSSIKVFIWTVLWIGRELIWWWLMTGLLALATSFIRSLPLTDALISRLRHLTPSASVTAGPLPQNSSTSLRSGRR
jgi:hypothetical protein